MNAIVIGGGHNGLIAAFYLAKAGLKPTVLERRSNIGGGAVTGEIHPGFRSPTLAHHSGTFRSDIFRDMVLERHGVVCLPAAGTWALDGEGGSVGLSSDVAPTVDSVRRISVHDADRYTEFSSALTRVSSVIASLFESPPPDIDHPSGGDLWNLLKTGRAFRSLGKRDAFNLLRWAPMPVADLMHDWFESELLGAAIAARGLIGAPLGPRSAGSALLLLLAEAHRQAGIDAVIRGGPGELTRALAASAAAAGVVIRTDSPVAQILVDGDRVAGVRLENGNEIRTSIVLSAVDPKTTFLRLVDPMDLTPEFVGRLQNYRARGTMAKMNLALSAAPRFIGVEAQDAAHVHLGPTLDHLERAFDHTKYGEFSNEPWLDVTIPSMLDPSMAPKDGHVMSIYAHHAPHTLRAKPWAEAAEDFRRAVFGVLERYAPGIEKLVVAEQLMLPEDLERDYGFTGGHIFHGELTIDQLFTMRPVLGYARYTTPITGLYLCGAGTHPGGFLSGQSGRLAARAVAGR